MSEKHTASESRASHAEKQRFVELVQRLRTATDPREIEQLKHNLAQLVFGSEFQGTQR